MVASDTHELAWAAGFVDGEGHFGLHLSQSKGKPRAYGTPQLNVAQKDRQVLDRLQKALGLGKVYGPYKHGNKKTQYFGFFVHNAIDIKIAIKMLWPWLSPVKRQQAEDTLLAFSEYTKRPKLKMGPKPRKAVV